MITLLKDLYAQFDLLYSDILFTCKGCSDHDCEGYIWLMPEESDILAEKDISVVVLNGNCNLINPFEESSLTPTDFERMRPKCRLRYAGLCSIYSSRPLVCRMYPVGLTSQDGNATFVLFKDCKFVRDMTIDQKIKFTNRAIAILSDCSQKLYDEIVETYLNMDVLSKYPDGANKYEVLNANR